MNDPIYLRAYRLARGLSQNDVAGILGFSDSSLISRWENGFSLPDLINAIRLAEIYGTTVEALFPDLREQIHSLGVNHERGRTKRQKKHNLERLRKAHLDDRRD